VICAGKQPALPASRQHVTPPKYCTIALGRKKRHSTRHQGIVLSPLSAIMPDAWFVCDPIKTVSLLSLAPAAATALVSYQTVPSFLRCCLPHDRSPPSLHSITNFCFPHARLTSSMCIHLFYLATPDCMTVRYGNCLSLRSYAHV
jgi:hypothetical protein